jgi:hypothetical protein
LMGVWSFIIDVFPKDRKAALCSKVHCWDWLTQWSTLYKDERM